MLQQRLSIACARGRGLVASGEEMYVFNREQISNRYIKISKA